MPGRLASKNAIVTGAGRSIGREVALLLAGEGANVVVNDPGVALDGGGGDRGSAAEVAAEIKETGGNAIANVDSVASVDGGERIVQSCLDAFGRVDILINAAGILRDRMIFNMSEEEWDEVIAVHLHGSYHTIKPAAALMRQQRWGRIVNFSSISGLQGNARQANYGAAKAGIAGLTRVVARDLGRYGVTCNAIAPGAATRMTESVPQRPQPGAVEPDDMRRPNIEPLREPGYVAPMTVWLCTDNAWNVNGKVFHVAGGSVSLALDEAPLRSISKAGRWMIDELAMLVPTQLMRDVRNPAPVQERGTRNQEQG